MRKRRGKREISFFFRAVFFFEEMEDEEEREKGTDVVLFWNAKGREKHKFSFLSHFYIR